MNLDFPSAMSPFLTATITVLASGTSRADASDVFRIVAASVRAGDPQTRTVGEAHGEQWSVSFPEDSWISTRKLTKGGIVEADPISGRWPRLTIQRVQSLAGMIVLECSAREKGVRP